MAQKLFCMGNPLLDISANGDEALLKKYEIQAGNAVLAEEKHMPLYDELAAKEDVVYVAGGATLNSARVASWVAGKAEQWVTYAGSIAEDKYGSLLVKDAEKEGLVMAMHKTTEAPTGTCAVVIVDKERSLVANLAAASKFAHEHVATAEVKKAVEEASVYYISGFFLTSCVPAFVDVAKHANEKEKVFTMNLSAPFIVDFFLQEEHLEYVDILFGNETEARALAKKRDWNTEDVKEIAIKAQALPKKGKARTVVFTQGAESTVVVTSEGATTYAVPKVDAVVDTNGAGDAFVGGFLAKFCAGADMETAVQTGHKAAGRIISVSGCAWSSKFE
eukprot:TRINITY_DN622_c0_g1_i1.p2 TRINITY_DN622_c0_g1~~TRINITY_DN622_c0_g1_i1.p2  ORF type:complete len:333 (+),score=170.20 TRINITY_DN622_c0_g1_i1:70-1068(+)